MSSDDITQRAISHSLTLNNFQAKTKLACPQFRDMREMMCLIDLVLFFSHASKSSELCTLWTIHLTSPGSGRYLMNLHTGHSLQVKAAVRVMMWTVDSSQVSNRLRGTNAPMTIQVKVTIRKHRGQLRKDAWL